MDTERGNRQKRISKSRCQRRKLLILGVTVVSSFLGLRGSSPLQVVFESGQLLASHSPVLAAVQEREESPRASEEASPAGSRAQSGKELLSVRLVPHQTTLWGARASQQFLVLANYADGLERDVTSQSLFALSDPQVATVDQAGKVSAQADGGTVLAVEFAGQVAKAKVRVEGSEEKRPFSFARDIGGIFTKKGCNSSDCHGSVKGKGGLKLSLDALYPREDFRWIVEGGIYQVLTPESAGPKEPRINLEEPEKSLLLHKATFSVPHGGGKLFKIDSLDYQAILNWIRSGAPYGKESEEERVKIEQIEVFPRNAVLDGHGKQQLLVSAHLSNGRREDITEQVLYVSNNPEVVKVTPGGLVEAVRTGETAVMIRATGHAVSARLGVIAEPVPDYPEVPRSNFLDEYVFAKLQKFSIIPSELSGDEEFLRRICLDVTGSLPPPQRVREFLADEDPQKREKLIEILLNTPEYVDYWTFRFSDLFRVGLGVSGPDTNAYGEWIRDSIAQNKPYDQMARERIAAQGFDGPSRHYVLYSKVPPVETLVAEEVRVFMGRRLDCAQCHNHPFETWSQNQFWGLAAFFGGMKATEWQSNLAEAGQVVFDDPEGQEVDLGVTADDVTGKSSRVIHPRTKEEVQPKFLDGTVPADERLDPRSELAQWITSHPYFAEAIVNRMWSYFFGRGMVDPVDDFRSTNPPTHPELLQALTQDFRDHGHDLKHLIRAIVSSRTYQLSSIPNDTNQDDEINYSHARARPLDAEVLLDAISAATGVPEVFENEAGGKAPFGTRAIHIKQPYSWPSRFLEIHGRPLRQTVPEREGKPNLAQALHLLVGSTYTEKLVKKEGRLHRLLESGASDREMTEALYLAALSRFPTDEERTELEKMIAQQSSRRSAFEHLLWALISSREFAYNH